MNDLTDEQLMAFVQKGKLNYMELIFKRYQKKLYNYFLKCTLDPAESEDLVQLTFIRVMKYRDSFRTDRDFRLWLFQIARNLVKDHFRKLKVHKDHFRPVEHIPDTVQEEISDEIHEREQRLHAALALLPSEKREILAMSKFQGMKYEQIAQIRQTSVSAVKVQVHRAIGQLRRIMFEELNDPS